MSKENTGIAILNTHFEAENAVKELLKAGFDMKKLSIVGKDYHTEEHVVGYRRFRCPDFAYPCQAKGLRLR